MIPLGEVEKRILRACQTLRALPDPDARFQQFKGFWPEVLRSTDDAYGYTEVTHPKFRPTPFDVSDYLNALAWARALERKEWRLIWWKSKGLSFRAIGFRIHKSADTAHRWYYDAIRRLWYSANGA